MAYNSPDILILQNPVGIDAIIQSLQQNLYAGLPWLQKAFGRAKECREGRERIPKVYVGLGEYYSVLPNDFLQSQCFFMAREPETPFSNGYSLQRTISVVFWVNLKKINPNNDYIFTEELRFEAEKIIKANKWVTGIPNFYDDRADDVYMGYLAESADETIVEALQYPYAGFRFDISVVYPSFATCVPWTTPFNPAIELLDDIDFVVGDDLAGQSIYQNAKMQGRKVRLIREGLKQHKQDIDANTWSWSFDSSQASIAVIPKFQKNERISIEIYGFHR
jgi:hypothetical protein